MTASATETQPSQRRFDPSRVPASEQARSLAEKIRNELLSYERRFHPRKKARKPMDQARFDRIVSAIVCDLAHSALSDPSAWRHISLSKRRHGAESVGAPFMTDARIQIIEWMSRPEMDWLELHKGEQIRNPFGGRQTTIRASARLRRHMDQADLCFADLGRDPALMGDPIVLRGEKVRGKATALAVPAGDPADRYRKEMLQINAWLAAANITCDCDDQGNERDAGDRWLTRIFNNGSLEEGGRPSGGFWADLSSNNRLRDVRIDGQEVASLDFGQCGVRIAYGLVGAVPPEGDQYLIPGLEPYREGVKKVLISQFFSPKVLSRRPKDSAKHLPKHQSLREVEELILRHHAPLRRMFYSGAGMAIQRIEGDILVRCLLSLIEREIVALPVYDCLVVARSSVEMVKSVMLQCFREVAGVEGAVTCREHVS